MVIRAEQALPTQSNRRWGTLHTATREVASNVWHLGRTISEKLDTGREKAQSYLDALYEVPNNVIFTAENIPTLGPRIASGWWFTVYRYEISGESRVLKIGHKHSPIYGYLDPPDERYPQLYNAVLEAQHKTFDSYLPYLILPQEVVYLSNGQEATTLIDQPYVPHQNNFEAFKELPYDQQEAILGEYELLEHLARNMRKEYGLQVDLFGDVATKTNNLAISKFGGKAHLVLLDNGPIDLNTPAPAVNSFATFVSVARVAFEKARFERIHMRSVRHAKKNAHEQTAY